MDKQIKTFIIAKNKDKTMESHPDFKLINPETFDIIGFAFKKVINEHNVLEARLRDPEYTSKGYSIITEPAPKNQVGHPDFSLKMKELQKTLAEREATAKLQAQADELQLKREKEELEAKRAELAREKTAEEKEIEELAKQFDF